MPISPVPLLIDEPNLSRAWARAFLHVLDHPGKEIAPLVLSISGYDEQGKPREDPAVRSSLDALLTATRNWDIETIAFTIFPLRIWEIAGGDREEFFTIARKTFPRYQAMNRINNGRGLYWERLIMYGSGPFDGNQLKHILTQFRARKGVRKSMLQGAIFDPGRDHTPSAQLNFPCLQHVSFVPTGSGLVVNAFYTTQQLFDKAYGNYLGLSRLGAFMAHEMNLTLARLNVFVGVEKLERINKTDPRLERLVQAARTCVNDGMTSAQPVSEYTNNGGTSVDA